jgi:hypothetical protein
VFPSQFVPPFQGLERVGVSFPGRCPGLICFGPFGAGLGSSPRSPPRATMTRSLVGSPSAPTSSGWAQKAKGRQSGHGATIRPRRRQSGHAVRLNRLGYRAKVFPSPCCADSPVYVPRKILQQALRHIGGMCGRDGSRRSRCRRALTCWPYSGTSSATRDAPSWSLEPRPGSGRAFLCGRTTIRSSGPGRNRSAIPGGWSVSTPRCQTATFDGCAIRCPGDGPTVTTSGYGRPRPASAWNHACGREDARPGIRKIGMSLFSCVRLR